MVSGRSPQLHIRPGFVHLKSGSVRPDNWKVILMNIMDILIEIKEVSI